MKGVPKWFDLLDEDATKSLIADLGLSLDQASGGLVIGERRTNDVKNQKAGRIIIVPHNLDLNELLNQAPPQKFRPTSDKLYYLVGLLTERQAIDRKILDEAKELPFVSLSSKLLKKKIHDYQKYLHYLVDSAVFECDNKYVVGGKAKGYRFTGQYRTIGRTQVLQDTALFSSTESEGVKESPIIASAKAMFDGLTIDRTSALHYLEDTYEQDKAHEPKRHHPLLNAKHNAHTLMVHQIAEKKFFFHVDSFSGRLHTNLTNIKSELRNFISYKGTPLVAIDLANAQPFFTLNLLSTNFYKKNKDSLLTFEEINFKNIYNINPPDIQPTNSLYPIMCGTFLTPAIRDELSLYSKAVSTGKFYEIFGTEIQRNYKNALARDQVKRIMYSVLFTESSEKRDFIVKNKELFKAVFPTVSRILDTWTQGNAANLAMVLQRIESYMFVEYLNRRIAEKLGEIPIFTIHDSMVTTEDYVDSVSRIMYDGIQFKTGYTPFFKTEMWDARKI